MRVFFVLGFVGYSGRERVAELNRRVRNTIIRNLARALPLSKLRDLEFRPTILVRTLDKSFVYADSSVADHWHFDTRAAADLSFLIFDFH